MIIAFDELNDRFKKAVLWFVNICALVNKSRIGEYEKRLSILADWTKQGILDQKISKENSSDFISLLYEVMEIEEIYKYLHKLDSKDLFRRIESIAQGPIFLADESCNSNSNQARNYQFELLTASRLKAAGFDIILTPDNDLAIRRLGRLIPIECKRPQSLGQVEKRINTGCKQLKKSYEGLPSDLRHPGMLMFSLEKLNSNYKYRARSETHEGVLFLLQEKCNHFYEKYESRIRAKGGSVGGFGVVLNTMSEVGGRLAYTTFSSYGYWLNKTVANELELRMGNLSRSTTDPHH